MQRLIARGLARIGTAGSSDPAGAARPSEQASTESAAALARQQRASARLRMAGLQDHDERLWQRLFEMEQGFAAPLSEPVPLPGLLPW